MKINIWLLLSIGALILSVIVLIDNTVAKLMGGFMLLVLLAYFAEVSRESKTQITRMQKALDKLRSAYSELDDQAKIIIRTDLELNRTQEELDKKITGLYTLHEIGKLISSTLEMQKVFMQITEPLILKLGYEKAIVFLDSPVQEKMECKAMIGFDSEQAQKIKQAEIRELLAKNNHRQKDIILVKDAGSASDEQRGWQKLFAVTSFVFIPLIVKDQAIGCLFVGNNNPYSRISKGDLDFLFILANQLSIAIDNAKLYAEIKLSHDELEIRVEDRTKELAIANDELLKLNKMKSDFVSAVSHELRTPLTSIKGYAAILMAGRLGEVSSVQQDKLRKINIHSDELIQLVNDLLDIARIESGKVGMDIRYISLTDIVKSTIDLFFPQVDEKQITLSADLPDNTVMVWADQYKIARVFMNLVANAIKFTPVNGEIILLVKPDDNFVRVAISDSGIGMSNKDLSCIFDEFYRVDNAINVEKKGTGLGLSLAKKIIEAHSGNIWVESEIGKGTTFYFTLSLRKIEAPQISVV